MNKERIKEFAFSHLIEIISIVIALISVVGSITYVLLNECKECEICEECDVLPSVESEEKVENQNIKVDIKGAVKKPGVYELVKGSNTNDAIKMAGGVLSTGTTNNINLSKKISDEMVIYVFTKKELEPKKTENKLVCEIPKCECEKIEVNNCIDNDKVNEPAKPEIVLPDKINPETKPENEKKEPVPENKPDIPPIDPNKKISINTATLKELMELDGVGEAKAAKIIEYRINNGPFKTIEDLKKVSGIGDKAFDDIKDRITI